MDRTEAIDPSADYYFALITARENGQKHCDVSTEFVRWGDDACRTEVRSASVVRADWAVDWCARTQVPLWIVHNSLDWCLFLINGGGGLVRTDVALERAPHLFGEKACATIRDIGFSSIEDASQAAKRAPIPSCVFAFSKETSSGAGSVAVLQTTMWTWSCTCITSDPGPSEGLPTPRT